MRKHIFGPIQSSTGCLWTAGASASIRGQGRGPGARGPGAQGPGPGAQGPGPGAQAGPPAGPKAPGPGPGTQPARARGPDPEPQAQPSPHDLNQAKAFGAAPGIGKEGFLNGLRRPSKSTRPGLNTLPTACRQFTGSPGEAPNAHARKTNQEAYIDTNCPLPTDTAARGEHVRHKLSLKHISRKHCRTQCCDRWSSRPPVSNA